MGGKAELVNEYMSLPCSSILQSWGRIRFRRRRNERSGTGLRAEKSYGGHAVLKGLDFHPGRGEIFALLGVNGAGKTTALECMEGLRSCDGGTVTVYGKIGIQLQSASLPAHIKPSCKAVFQVEGAEPDGFVLVALGMREMERKQYVQLSTGRSGGFTWPSPLIGDPTSFSG